MIKIPKTASNIVYLQISLNVIVKEFGKVVYNTWICKIQTSIRIAAKRKSNNDNMYR